MRPIAAERDDEVARPTACRSATIFANTLGQQPVAAEREEAAPDEDADRERERHRVEDHDELEEGREPRADVLGRHLAHGARRERPGALGDGLLAVADREGERHQDEERARGADRPEHGARDRVMRVVRLLAERGRRLEADEEQDSEQDAAEHAAARDAEPGRLARVEHRERDAVVAALAR